ncbi:MAG: type VI secretion protein, partial [Rhodobacter sp.]|nr:type VI secretion protein [Rhodobacter sp.]
MGKARIATGAFLVTLVTAAMGYAIASAVLTYQDLGFGAEIDFAYIAQNYASLLDQRPEDAQLIHLTIGGFAAAGLMLSLALSGSALTRFGQTHWQSAREMKANGFFGAPGTGFILGKLGPPGSRANYICSKVFPHALIVAPTGRGKTSGFVIPNLLTWQGSVVTLDVKGECFEATARHRAAQGDKVYRF